MADSTNGSGPSLGWELAGTFGTYTEGHRAAEELAASRRLPPSAVSIWPVALRVVAGDLGQARNDLVTRCGGIGMAVGVSLGFVFGAVNAVVGLIGRPTIVRAALLFAGAVGGGVVDRRDPGAVRESRPRTWGNDEAG